MKNQEPHESPEKPLHGKVLYRRISDQDSFRGEGVSLGGSELRFTGEQPLTKGEAAEVRIDAVKGLSPPLTAYIEVATCAQDGAQGYRIEGVVKGIQSH